ncbi:glycosyltransferase [Helicobacter marmotae]|uniref:glycosyltransferase n=1 Tax=Helicobacter marmotae TaxID=152490 RepID=UPI001F33CCC8|nr:glycosyltransferase [Helicobacter marmotae]
MHIVTQDNGGAGRACVRLHKALLNAGVDSIILTQNKTTDLASIQQIAKSKLQKAFAKIRPFISQLPLQIYPKRQKDIFSPNLPIFTPTNRALLKTIEKLKPDVVHLHWIENGFFSIKDLAYIKAPLLWSLHDANPYTGGCHYVAAACIGVGTHCKSCPLLQSKFTYDVSFWTFRRKQKTYNKLNNLTINGLSHWIATCAKQSALLGNKPIINLPNPIDTRIYRPLNKHFARECLQIAQNKRLICFGAIGATQLPRKGFSALSNALKALNPALKAKCELLIFGASAPSEDESLDMPTHYLGTLSDDTTLALVYSASDVFIMPSFVESFGQTALESLSCGTPVVCFETSGLKDIITHRTNGYLARCFESSDLKNGIEWVLNQSAQEYAALSLNARKSAVAKFDTQVIAPAYIDIYRQLAGGGAVDKLRVANAAKAMLHALFPDIFKPAVFYVGFGAIGGSSTPRKGFNELAYALSHLSPELKSRTEVLVFGGSAFEIEGIKQTHLLGFVHDDSALSLAFNACDVFVAPSLAENLSNVIMESLSCGTPVVCFDIGGNSDLITHKSNGYLAKAGDRDDLKNGIEWIANLNRESYEHLAFNAYRHVSLHFHAPLVAKAYIEAYKQLTGGGA